MNLFFLKVHCALHWGWKLNVVPFSKSRPPLKVPPPTTLIGALAYPLNRALNIPESFGEYSSAERLRNVLSYVGFCLNTPLITYFDLTKISFFYRKEARTDAIAAGKTYLLASELERSDPPEITICYVINEDKAIQTFGSGITKKLIEAAYGITRIGSRESTVAPLNVSYGNVKILSQKAGDTIFSFSRKSANPLKGNFTIIDVIDWEQTPIGDYTKASRTQLIVPYDERAYRSSSVTVEVSNGYVLIEVEGDMMVARWPM